MVDESVQNKPKLSRLAVASVVCAVMPPVLLGTALAVQPESGWASICIGLSICTSVVLSIVLGHKASRQIRKNSEVLRGRRGAILGLVIGYSWVAVILSLAYLTPVEHKYPAVYEASAVGTVRSINVAEREFKQSSAAKSYGCSMGDLAPLIRKTYKVQDKFDENLLDKFVKSGYRSGYVFTIACSTADHSLYSVTAVPADPPKSGVRIFCSDQTETIRLVMAGAGSDCIRDGKPLD